MARKQSLSDLLQEEAQKFTPPEGESAIEVTAEAIAEEEASSDEESSAQTPELNSTRRTSPTKADLEVTVKELTTNLEIIHKNEVSLGQEIADLQSKLSKQQTLVSEQKLLLQQVTKELEETKKTALQLAEANSQLIEEINALKQTAEENSKKLVVKETTAIKPAKEHYNPLNYKKSHRSSETLAQNQPQNQPNEYPDSSNEMWLLD
jgi:DNA gyrase/topoisomerase IV subunit A